MTKVPLNFILSKNMDWRGKMRIRMFLLVCVIPLLIGADKAKFAVIEDYAGIVRVKLPNVAEFKIEESHKGKEIVPETKIVTARNSELRLRMQDGTEVRIKESSNAQLFKDEKEKLFGVVLTIGWIRAKIASDGFQIRTPAHRIGGVGLDVEVKIDREGRLTVFCIEEKGYVKDAYGGELRISEGQKFDLWHDKERDAYCLHADEHNETDAEYSFGDKKRKIGPDEGLALSKDGKFLPLVPPPPPGRDVIVRVPEKAEEPEDEPYEDSGELQEAPYVSPKKPQKK